MVIPAKSKAPRLIHGYQLFRRLFRVPYKRHRCGGMTLMDLTFPKEFDTLDFLGCRGKKGSRGRSYVLGLFIHPPTHNWEEWSGGLEVGTSSYLLQRVESLLHYLMFLYIYLLYVTLSEIKCKKKETVSRIDNKVIWIIYDCQCQTPFLSSFFECTEGLCEGIFFKDLIPLTHT